MRYRRVGRAVTPACLKDGEERAGGGHRPVPDVLVATAAVSCSCRAPVAPTTTLPTASWRSHHARALPHRRPRHHRLSLPSSTTSPTTTTSNA